jgi:hypothetical protein
MRRAATLAPLLVLAACGWKGPGVGGGGGLSQKSPACSGRS